MSTTTIGTAAYSVMIEGKTDKMIGLPLNDGITFNVTRTELSAKGLLSSRERVGPVLENADVLAVMLTIFADNRNAESTLIEIS